MSTLFPHIIAVQKRTGQRVNGKWTETSTTANITGSVQPVSGKDTQFLPENRRDTGVVKVYSKEPLSVSIEGSNTPGDVVIWAGKKWEVFQELVYANGLINHHKYFAAYIGEAT